MKFGVMGAGAVGSYLGGMLARAGHSVTLIGRRRHVSAVTAEGLLLETARFSERVAVKASTDASALADVEVVLFCVKSGDTPAAGRDMAPHLKSDTALISLQNGVDNAERLERVLGRAVVPGVVYLAAEMAGLGHVKHNGQGEVVIGPCARATAIADTFTAAGIATKVSNDVIATLWRKLISNCAYNALSAVAQMPYGPLVKVDGVTAVMGDVMAECFEVARRLGISIPADTADMVLGIAAAMPAQLSSTAQDVARGKPSEIDHINGYVVRKAAELGIATPANRALQIMVKAVEAGRQSAGGGR